MVSFLTLLLFTFYKPHSYTVQDKVLQFVEVLKYAYIHNWCYAFVHAQFEM